MIGPSRSGKTTMMMMMIDEALKTHSHVTVISSRGSVTLPGKVVSGQVVTDSGELEAGSDDPD